MVFLQKFCTMFVLLCVFSSVVDIRDVINKVPIIISALQIAYCRQCLAMHLLS
jgi:hypothetical protein